MQASATNREQRQAVIVDQALTHSTFEVAFAGEVPAAWARRECEGEELCLSEIALALVPLWPAIQAAWNRSPQQVRIFTERLLQIYLRFWPASSRRQRRSPHQNAVTLLRAIRRAAQRADGPLTAIELRALFRRVIALPRAVPICFSTDRTPDLDDSALVPLPERRLRVLFREFYFPGLTPDELRTGLALASKLRFHALKQEVPLLLNFLFYAAAGKASIGLFPHWQEVLPADSKYRHEDALLSHYDWIKAQANMDTKLSIIAEKIATKVAGAAPAHTERELKQRTDAFEKALKRLPEKLQKRQAKRSDKPRR